MARTYTKQPEPRYVLTAKYAESVAGGTGEGGTPSKEFNQLKSDVENFIKDVQTEQGVTVYSAKHSESARTDSSGNVIDKTYTKKTETQQHNASTDAHNDIRLLLQELSNRVNTLLDSDDETLNQTSEIVAFAKANKSLIDSITTSKVSVVDIVNNLTTNVTNKPLSAAQGVALKALIDALSQNKLSASELQTAINTALAQAKASGEFDGAKGEDGTDGQDGKDGISATHAWNGTVLTITSASGSSSVDLKGEKGEKGDTGEQGPKGDKGEIGATGPEGPKGNTGETGSAGKNGADGVGVKSVTQTTTSSADGGSNVITVTLTNGNTSTFTVKNGSKGSTGAQGIQGIQGVKGDKGDKGDTGATGAKGADGKTPVKGTDYFTNADKQEMVESVKKSLDGVPDYWLTALQNGAKAINTDLCTAGANKSAFLFYSDAHWNYGSQKSPLLLKYLYEHTGMTKTIFGGDIVNNEATGYEAMSYLWDWRNMLKGLPNHHSVVGNHDDGNATNNLFSEQYVYGYLLAPEETADIVRGDSGMYYYIDSPAEKTRYLYLDTAYKGVTDKQKEFVKNALISTNEGWHIVAVSHIWYDTNYNTSPPSVGALNSGASELLAMFDSYNSCSGDYTDGKGKVEFCIGGHTHRDYVGSTTGGIPIILVETDSQHVRSGLGYTAGTTTESSVNGIVADYNTNKVNIIRIGRGSSFIVDIATGGTEEPDTPVTPTYTNMLDTAGFVVGKYLSNGNEVADANAYTTGYIPCKGGDIIRLKNITMPNESSHGNRFSAYDSSKNWISGTTFSMTGSLTDHSPVFEGGNLVQFKVGYFSGMAYIRLSAWKIDETSIITVNESID